MNEKSWRLHTSVYNVRSFALFGLLPTHLYSYALLFSYIDSCFPVLSSDQIMDRIKEFFHTKTPKEIMQENKRAIRQARRELEREKNRLNNEKTRNENEIRKLAAKGEQVR